MYDEIRPRHGRNGREARTALPVAPRTKALLAAMGVVVSVALAGLAWWWGFAWATGIMLALALWAMADIAWQWHRIRARNRDEPTTKGTPP